MPYDEDDDEEIELSGYGYGYGYGPQIEEVGADKDDDLDDILGAMEIVDEDSELGEDVELGAGRVHARRRYPRYSRQVVRRRPQPRPVRKVLRTVQPTRLHDLPLPIERTLIPAGEHRVIQLQPQLPFKPYRLSIPSIISGQLLIDDVKVGNASQFVASGQIPVECFDTDATNIRLKGDTANPGVDIILIVSNMTTDDRWLVGMIVGDVAQC